MRTVSEINYEDMSPELRALICYESNGSLDVPDPQRIIDHIRRVSPVVRWEVGVGFF
jgi:hypothetical protein